MTKSFEGYEYIEEKFENSDPDSLEEALSQPIPILEPIQIESISIRGSGNKRTWREFEVPGGWTKYCNWSASFKILDLSGNEIKCDWIEVTDCNFRIKQGPIWKETGRISFTTRNRKGWKSLKTSISFKYGGMIYETHMKL